jgi:transcriptional regulator with PAS, ATPase and Fis domain
MKVNDTIIKENHLPQFERLMGNEERTLVNDESYTESSLTLENIVEKAEQGYIAQVMKECANNKTKAAKLMNISLRSLYYKLEKYGMQ